MKKSIIRIICFILTLTIVLGKVNDVFSFKCSVGNTMISDFYRLDDDTVDVVIVGSSHVFYSFNNGTLWNEYGISSYDLGAASQPMWNSYYYLKEALKTQTPELIILEGYGLSYDFEYFSDFLMHNTYGMKWSLDKIEAIKESASDEEELNYLFDYAQYHTRYSALNRGDFFPESEYMDSIGYWHFNGTMGQYLSDTSVAIEIPDVSYVKEKKDLHEKAEKYYRKIIELAQKNEIPIVVIVAPYVLSEVAQSKYLKAQEIAEEYGVKFLNTNLLLGDIGFNFSTDYRDNEHMNIEGSRKFSLYVGKYLKDNFEISDHRGDPKYSAWDKCAAYTEQYLQDMYLKNSYDLYDISNRLSNENYWIYITLDGSANSSDEIIGNFLKMQGINADPSQVMWMKKKNELVYHSGYEESEHYTQTALHDICLKRVTDDQGNYSNQIILDNQQYKKVSNGLNVLVYNSLTDRIADCFGINMDDNYNIVR